MLHFSTPITLRLERGGLLNWPRRADVRLRVLTGSAWVTQANDLEDHFLQPGQTLVLRAGSHAVIGAEEDASLCFETDRGFGVARLWQRLLAWFTPQAPRTAALPRGTRPA